MITIGIPIIFLITILASFVWQITQSKKGNLSFKLSSSWAVFNILFFVVMTYILITNIISSINGTPDFNIINIISEKVFGFTLENDKVNFTWLIWVIIWCIFTIGLIIIGNSLKISILNNRLDELNRSVAIVKGKLNKSIKLTSNSVDTNELTLDEFNTLLKNKFEKEAAIIQTNSKYGKNKLKKNKKLFKYEDDFNE